MKNLAMQMSDAFTVSTKLTRARYQIAEAYSDYFPVAEFSHYDAFLTIPGESLKRERRTLVTLIRRPRQGSSAEEVSSFVLKVYKYPFFPRLRTGFQISKAEREFDSLRYLNEIGLGAAQAVGYGVERTRLGFVRSCFIITRFIDDSINLSQWYVELERHENLDGKSVDELFTQLGRMFRRLHEARFFLFTAKAKNILIRNYLTRGDQVFLIDLPYARFLKWPLLARWAQARDIGVLFGNVTAALSAKAIELFYRAYLPDPLGFPSNTVRRYAARQMHAKQNRTLISRWVHDIKRYCSGKTRRTSVS